MNKDIKIELVVVGTGDQSVGIPPSVNAITVTFHDQDPREFDTEEMINALKSCFTEMLENCRTRAYTKEEYDAMNEDEEELVQDWGSAI